MNKKVELQEAMDSISKNNDVKSAKVIIENTLLGSYVITGGRVNLITRALTVLMNDHDRLEKENNEKPYIEEFMKLCNHKEKVIELMADEIVDLLRYSRDAEEKTKQEVLKEFESKAKESE